MTRNLKKCQKLFEVKLKGAELGDRKIKRGMEAVCKEFEKNH
jgi:hypothetical protein